jgi:hypothetical protein
MPAQLRKRSMSARSRHDKGSLAKAGWFSKPRPTFRPFSLRGEPVGTTGIEPVTPTMSTQCVDRNYSKIPEKCASNVRFCSRLDHGNLGRFLGLEVAHVATA